MKLGNRLLVIVSERIGDVIFCTPAIALLKQQLPAAAIDVLAPSAAAASVFEHNPIIRNIYTAPDKKTLKTLANEYDNVIDFHNNKITRQYSAALNLPIYNSPRSKRDMHQSAVACEFITSLLNCNLPDPSPYLLYPQPKHFNNIEQLLADAHVDLNNDILIGCHMGCSQIMRRGWKIWKKTEGHKSWPVTNFIELEQKLRRNEPRIRFILTGSKSESHLCQQLAVQSKKAVDLSGKTSVLELTALMNYLHIFLTGDTGPLHVACATSKPVVTLFGPTSPIETGPYPLAKHHTVIHKPQIEEIAVDTVYLAIKDNLTKLGL